MSVTVIGEQMVKAGETPSFTVQIAGTEAICDLKVNAVYRRPGVAFQNVIKTLGEKGSEADIIGKDVSRFPRVQELASLRETEAGIFNGSLGSVLNTGIINAYLTITGTYLDGTPFVAKKLHSVFVE